MQGTKSRSRASPVPEPDREDLDVAQEAILETLRAGDGGDGILWTRLISATQKRTWIAPNILRAAVYLLVHDKRASIKTSGKHSGRWVHLPKA